MQLTIFLIFLPSTLAFYKTVTVGQLFLLGIRDREEFCFPRWLTSSEYGIWGIPGVEDIGMNLIFEKKAGNRLINRKIVVVYPENRAPCFPEETSWLEIHFDIPPSIENKINSLNYISKSLKVNTDTLRVYDYEYSRTNRRLEAIGHQDQTPGQYLVTWPIGCTTFNNATDIMADFLDKNLTYHSVYLAQGYFKPRKSYKITDDNDLKCRPATENVWPICVFGFCF
ncbi:unnamed protein product [Caenorhabditis brenneri]